MNESDLDDLFSELGEDDKELHDFLGRMQENMPAALFQLKTEDGRLLPPEVELCSSLEEGFLAAIPGEEGISRIKEAAGNLHAVSVPRLAALLFIKLPDSYGDFADNPALSTHITGFIELALLRREHENLSLENQQIQRQIDVFKQQHYKLVEDNYRQYRLLQDREKDYARKLEDEIARQTAELRKANARLEESSRLKSEFLANMSHELRTPLNAIIGFSELLAETGLQGEQAEYGDIIRTAGNSLLALINDILDLSKVEAGKIDLESEPFGLAEMISRVRLLFGARAREKGVAFTVSVDKRLPGRLLGDANRLQQILVNLVGNAFKFTSAGGVDLRAEPAGERGGEILVRFTVTDTGIGIPIERQQAVFEKFTQADGSTTRKYGGTGLGLAICSHLVTLMKGEIRLESMPGKGSTFAFTVPLLAEPVKIAANRVELPPESGKPEAQPEPGSALVLLVEDNPVNQRLAGIMLRRLNCRVLVAGDGVEALEVLERQRCDLILMDIQMPRLDGLATTRKIRALESSPARANYAALRESNAPLTIIGLTAHARKEDEQASREAGMNDFLTKPIDRGKLTMILEKYLARS